MNQTYIVKEGDTLYGISNQFGVSVTELAELNNIQGSFLRVGRELIIPIKTGTNPNNLFMYTVKQGDTLYGIARKYNTTVKKIIDLNYLKNTSLNPGQIIRIPEMYTKEEDMYMPNYKNYIVKKGDTLYSVAKDNNIDVNTLIKDNGLTTNTLTIGQTLRIRISEVNEEIEECFGPDYAPKVDINPTITYIVKKGDNLYNIAKVYNTSVANIVSLNNLKNTNLSIGQQLKIPNNQSNSPTSTTYIVKKGDSLYTIAKKYNTTVDSIKRKNNLVTNNLSIGQKLII